MPAEAQALLSLECFDLNPAGQICKLLEADYRGVTTSTWLWRSAMLFFYHETRQPSLVSDRTSLLVACLFSALVNRQGSESVMGRTESLTLVDRIHLVAVYIFAGAIATVFLRLTAEAGQAKQAMWLDRRLLFRVLTISFIVQNPIVISYVVIVGG